MGLIITVIEVAFEVYMALMFVRILLSWVKHNPYQPVIKFIYEITEPVLGFFRRIIPPLGVVDLSPIAAFFVMGLVKNLIIYLLIRL
ncbi:MAG: YggT family protein [Bacillota bacterium]